MDISGFFLHGIPPIEGKCRISKRSVNLRDDKYYWIPRSISKRDILVCLFLLTTTTSRIHNPSRWSAINCPKGIPHSRLCCDVGFNSENKLPVSYSVQDLPYNLYRLSQYRLRKMTSFSSLGYSKRLPGVKPTLLHAPSLYVDEILLILWYSFIQFFRRLTNALRTLSC